MDFPTVAELSSFQTVKSTSVTSAMELRTVREATRGLMDANTQESLATGNSMEKDPTVGRTVPCTQVNFKME